MATQIDRNLRSIEYSRYRSNLTVGAVSEIISNNISYVVEKESFMRMSYRKMIWNMIGILGTALALTACTFNGLGGDTPSANQNSAEKDYALSSPEVESATGDYALSSPDVESTTRDIIEFGSYWQEDTNGDGVANQDDDKTPIKWQILKQDGDDLFLLADHILACKPYNDDAVTRIVEDGWEDLHPYADYSSTWEKSSLRQWLNKDFYEDAFSESEKEAVKQTTVINEGNSHYDTEGGKDTTDKLFLLSLSEITNEDYGFQSDRSLHDQERYGKATAYAIAQGCAQGNAQRSPEGGSSEGSEISRKDTCRWWLRSPGYIRKLATEVNSDGDVNDYGEDVRSEDCGVRPALHLNRSSSVWKKG